MALGTRLRTQALFLFAGAALLCAALSPNLAHPATAWPPVLGTAAIVTVVFLWAWRLSGSRTRGLTLALLVGFGAMLWLRASLRIGPLAAALSAAGTALLATAALSGGRFDAGRGPAVSKAAPPIPSGPVFARTPQAAFDALVALLGFDSEHPGWFPALRDLHRHARQKRLQVLPDFFYTSVFSPRELPASVWSGTFPACGTFDLAAERTFLAETPDFREALEKLPVDRSPEGDSVYHWNNEQFSHADAALYYAFIRRFRPKRIVEVGSGHSTKLARRAVRDNGTGSIVCIEPHPPAWLKSVEGEIEVRRMTVQDAPDSLFIDLQPSDILFIDGSHISKTGSDVNHLFLRILPRLPAGVLVQIHDICLPYEYQRSWSEDALCYWNEQYVLAGLLANSSKFEILVGVYFLQKTAPELLTERIPELPGVMPGGGSLWMRSRA